MSNLYVPGCALMSYKPDLAYKLKEVIENKYGKMDTLLTCCFRKPELDSGTRIFTPCATCASRYEKLYPDCTSIFFLKEMAESDDFIFPDYNGIEMSIQDPCSARTEPEYLSSVRKLLERMNIKIVEAQRSGSKSKCCGQTFYGKTDNDKIRSLMVSRANEMPCENVVVYCASCIMSMTVGGRKPRYILDLLFGEETQMPDADIKVWNEKLRMFRVSQI
ncbi:MAG: heterodisulfide reductase-related iron-sulfur binding cluster [Parabacteroides sp.]|nr:heterodisulfide reductase-related iron-sulfur binding cluster [Parabacteroides sp.]